MGKNIHMPYNYFFFCLASRSFPQYIQPAEAADKPASTLIHTDGAGGVDSPTRAVCLLN